MKKRDLTVEYLKGIINLVNEPAINSVMKNSMQQNFDLRITEADEIHNLALHLLNELVDVNIISSDNFEIKDISFDDFKELVSTKEGIVCLGAADPDEWINGIANMFAVECATPLGDEDDRDPTNPSIYFEEYYQLETTGLRNDLVLMLKEDAPLDLSKLALWRLRFDNISWVSDYIVNYADQFGK